jgi:hypothetical protein
MIDHRRIAPDRSTENHGEFVDPILDPSPTMLEGSTRPSILAAQKRPTYAAQDAMESTRQAWRNQDGTGAGNGASIGPELSVVRRKSSRRLAGKF